MAALLDKGKRVGNCKNDMLLEVIALFFPLELNNGRLLRSAIKLSVVK